MTEFLWRGVTLGPAPFVITTVEGWYGLPGGTAESLVASGHGVARSPVWQGSRAIRMRGTIRGYDETTRDALLGQLRPAIAANGSLDPTTEPLAGDRYGQWMTAEAQLIAFTVPVESGRWPGGVPAWDAEFRCPDPRFYGDWISDTADLATAPTGVVLPQTLPFTFPANPLGGQVSLYNPGDDLEGSPLRVVLTGGQTGTVGITVTKPSGAVDVCTWNVTLAGNRGDGLPNRLVVDTELGGAFLDGAYRPTTPGGRVSSLRLEPGVNVVRALGTAGAGSPSIEAAVRPRSW